MDSNSLLTHYYDEGDSAYIYSVLSSLSRSRRQKQVFRELQEKELEHQQIFVRLLNKNKIKYAPYRPSLKIKLMAWLARSGFAASILKIRIFDESREVGTYLLEANQKNIPGTVARDEASHSQILQKMTIGRASETWHHHETGGMLRNIIYGFNDGLTANFGLIMGVIGSAANHQAVLISGLAGLIADTLSMGSSSFLAATSEQEVQHHEIALEKEEMELMPKAEQKELSLIYQSKGYSTKLADKIAKDIMAGGQKLALAEMTTQELGIAAENIPPLKEGVVTGLSTMFGAVIPLLPLFFGHSLFYIILAFAISMLTHFAVGALRSIFTGRGIIRSGFDMFIVGLGVAAIAYFIGDFIVTRIF